MMQSSQKIGGQTLLGTGLYASMQLLRAVRVSENPRAIANLPHDVRTLNRCLTSKPSALCMISNHGFFAWSSSRILTRHHPIIQDENSMLGKELVHSGSTCCYTMLWKNVCRELVIFFHCSNLTYFNFYPGNLLNSSRCNS